MTRRVTLGRIGGPHGIKGWVKILSFTEPRENILGYRQLEVSFGDKAPLCLEMDDGRIHGKGLLAHFVGYDTPESAQQLNGGQIEIDAEALPALADGEYYWHQLIGMKVVNRQGIDLGRIDHMLETGANDVMVIAATVESIDDRERLLPWLPERTVLRVDIAKGEVQVDWEPDYLA
ncbi:MAG: ribosome maturation factor RimM [Pseudomonadales bacterium]|nr:ribosome maturation factor RimM [Pseudomonadales bacterium]